MSLSGDYIKQRLRSVRDVAYGRIMRRRGKTVGRSVSDVWMVQGLRKQVHCTDRRGENQSDGTS